MNVFLKTQKTKVVEIFIWNLFIYSLLGFFFEFRYHKLKNIIFNPTFLKIKFAGKIFSNNFFLFGDWFKHKIQWLLVMIMCSYLYFLQVNRRNTQNISLNPLIPIHTKILKGSEIISRQLFDSCRLQLIIVFRPSANQDGLKQFVDEFERNYKKEFGYYWTESQLNQVLDVTFLNRKA